MKVLSYAQNVPSILTVGLFFSFGFYSTLVTNGQPHFVHKPEDMAVKTGSTVTMLWDYEDPDKLIDKGEIFRHIQGENVLMFKINPNENTSAVFGEAEYLKRVDITVPVPLNLSRISSRMVMSNVTTADTGFYSFKVSRLTSGLSSLSNVSLYVTERPHSLNINVTKHQNLSKKIGESLYVKCKLAGTPTPTVTWVNKNNETKAEGEGSALLVLYNITEKQKGIYTCKGNNSDGALERSIFLEVIYLRLTCHNLIHKDGKIIMRFTAFGYPSPVCKFKNTIIKCDGGEFELKSKDFNETVTSRNSAGLEKSCPRFTEFGNPSGAGRRISCSMFLFNFLFLTSFVMREH